MIFGKNVCENLDSEENGRVGNGWETQQKINGGKNVQETAPLHYLCMY